MQQKQKMILWAFLLVQSVLYYFILTSGGQTLVITSYLSIILCFIFSLQNVKTAPFMVAGLACTAGADFCLVICNPIQQLWGMVFFLGAQMFYALYLHKNQKNKPILWARILLTAGIIIFAIVFLQDKVDALAIISVAYYANLFMNIIAAFAQWRRSKLLPIALVLFILCDTVIGLQVAAGGYLPITEGSALYNLLFSGFNTAWLFYLPSQVLLALHCMPKGTQNGKSQETDR